MITFNEVKSRLEKHKTYLKQKYNLKYIAVFGSVSRGDSTGYSDIDILVDFAEPIGIKFIDLADELESILKYKIDLVSRNAVKPKYFEQIKNDLKYV